MNTSYIPFIVITLVFIVYLYQESKEFHVIFTCTKCKKRVRSKEIKEGCLCSDCYEEEKNNDNSTRSKTSYVDSSRRRN